MKSKLKLIVTVALFTLLNGIIYSQSGVITIRYIGNCGLHISDGMNHIYSDFPYKSGAYNYLEYDSAELDSLEKDAYYIFTHRHNDHFSRKLVRQAKKLKAGKSFGSWNIPELMQLNQEIPGFNVEAFKTNHHLSMKHYSYLITWHGKRIYLSGDTESAETINKVEQLDWAFVPAWLLRDAVEKELKINAANIGIYHIGPKDNINITGEKIRMLKTPGETILLPY